jgi:hypothetical protein
MRVLKCGVCTAENRENSLHFEVECLGKAAAVKVAEVRNLTRYVPRSALLRWLAMAVWATLEFDVQLYRGLAR